MAAKIHPFFMINVAPESWEFPPNYEACAYSRKTGEIRLGTKRRVKVTAQSMYDAGATDVVVYFQKIPKYAKSLPVLAR